jgi:vancomycin aglycone glucosyltransferase
MYDQHYWAQRVDQLGIGTAHAPGTPTVDSLAKALRRALDPEVAERAQKTASSMRSDGAQVAARRLISSFGVQTEAN